MQSTGKGIYQKHNKKYQIKQKTAFRWLRKVGDS